MSIDDFWMNVRTGARSMAPTVTADGPWIDATDVERLLLRDSSWLTRKTVRGFDEADFDFLPDEERTALAKAVEGFREIARQVPRDQPPSDEQVQAALPEFRRIVDILRPDKYADAEAMKLGRRIEQELAGQIPESVAELRYETGEDWHGGPGLWIWVVLKNEAAEDDVLIPNVREVRRLLQDTVEELEVKRFPFFHFRAVSDLEPLSKFEAKK
jgi:hypothetical protein